MRLIFGRMSATAILLIVGVVVAACSFEVGEDEGSGLESSVAAMLEGSAGAWNDGDLEAFMAIYADAPTTSFMTFDGPVYGRESIKTGYAAAFAPGGPRDSLRFEDLTVRQLPPLIGLATARYVLHRGGQVTSTGWFTIVLRRVGGGWLVIHDHSSESPLPATDQPEEAPE